MSVLILGAPGSGKTYLALQAKSQGMSAFDADTDIPGLAGWVDSQGRSVVFPNQASAEWLKAHSFLWSPRVLEVFLHEHPQALVFGVSANAFESTRLFDRAYYLKITPKVLAERMMRGDRINPMGKTVEQQALILETVETVDMPLCERYSVKILPADLPAEELLQRISRGI